MTNSLVQEVQMFRNAVNSVEPRTDLEETMREFFCIKLARKLGQTEQEQPDAFETAIDQFSEPELIRQQVRAWSDLRLNVDA